MRCSRIKQNYSWKCIDLKRTQENTRVLFSLFGGDVGQTSTSCWWSSSTSCGLLRAVEGVVARLATGEAREAWRHEHRRTIPSPARIGGWSSRARRTRGISRRLRGEGVTGHRAVRYEDPALLEPRR